MITIYNIRGTNGSGKSTLARTFINGDPRQPANRPGTVNSPTMVDLCWYASPTKADARRRKSVEAYCWPSPELDVLVVGSYRTACGGLDAVPDFNTTFRALDGAVSIHERHLLSSSNQAIIAEGVLASTVWRSWGEYAAALAPRAEVAFCYLDTPLEVCLERIRRRQEASGKVREIKTELVADKIKAVAATRQKAIDAGHLVYDLPHEEANSALRAIMANGRWTAPPGTLSMPAREHYSA